MTTRCIRTLPDGTGYRVSVDAVALDAAHVDAIWAESFHGQRAPDLIPTRVTDTPDGHRLAEVHARLDAEADKAATRIGWTMASGYIQIGEDTWRRFAAVDLDDKPAHRS